MSPSSRSVPDDSSNTNNLMMNTSLENFKCVVSLNTNARSLSPEVESLADCMCTVLMQI